MLYWNLFIQIRLDIKFFCYIIISMNDKIIASAEHLKKIGEKTYKNLFSASPDLGAFFALSEQYDDYFHCHDYYEIFYITCGKITHICNGIEEQLEKGDAYLLKPEDIHSFIRTKDTVCIHRDIGISKKSMESILQFINEGQQPDLNYRFPVKTHFNINSVSHYENLFNMLNSDITQDKQLYRPKLKTIIISIIGEFLNSSTDNSNTLPPVIRRVIDHLSFLTNLRAGMPNLVKSLNYSRHYLCRVFKKYTNQTLSEYIKNLRLQNAAIYLKSTNLTLTEITQQIGIESLSYFNKIFKQKYGVTPAKYRQKQS